MNTMFHNWLLLFKATSIYDDHAEGEGTVCLKLCLGQATSCDEYTTHSGILIRLPLVKICVSLAQVLQRPTLGHAWIFQYIT